VFQKADKSRARLEFIPSVLTLPIRSGDTPVGPTHMDICEELRPFLMALENNSRHASHVSLCSSRVHWTEGRLWRRG